MNFYNQILFL
jgi:metal-sulfur cluster biosynthetic enzyme